MKYQQGSGSVDEKLQTCGFKLRQYSRLFETIDYEAKYYFLLSDWFEQSKYKDVKEYIQEENCDYFIGNLPLDKIQLDEANLKKYRP